MCFPTFRNSSVSSSKVTKKQGDAAASFFLLLSDQDTVFFFSVLIWQLCLGGDGAPGRTRLARHPGTCLRSPVYVECAMTTEKASSWYLAPRQARADLQSQFVGRGPRSARRRRCAHDRIFARRSFVDGVAHKRSSFPRCRRQSTPRMESGRPRLERFSLEAGSLVVAWVGPVWTLT